MNLREIMSASCNTSQCRYQLAESDAVALRRGKGGERIYGHYISRTAHTCTRRDGFWIRRGGKSIGGRRKEPVRVSGKEMANRSNETSAIIYPRINRSDRPKAITARHNVSQFAWRGRSFVCFGATSLSAISEIKRGLFREDKSF